MQNQKYVKLYYTFDSIFDPYFQVEVGIRSYTVLCSAFLLQNPHKKSATNVPMWGFLAVKCKVLQLLIYFVHQCHAFSIYPLAVSKLTHMYIQKLVLTMSY